MGKNLLSVVFSLAFVITVSFSVSAQIQVGPSPDDPPNLPEPVVKAPLVTPDRPSLPPLVPGILGSGELETRGLPKSSSPPSSSPIEASARCLRRSLRSYPGRVSGCTRSTSTSPFSPQEGEVYRVRGDKGTKAATLGLAGERRSAGWYHNPAYFFTPGKRFSDLSTKVLWEDDLQRADVYF